jgi:prepilin-type processing-associated H-X9-DG protein
MYPSQPQINEGNDFRLCPSWPDHADPRAYGKYAYAWNQQWCAWPGTPGGSETIAVGSKLSIGNAGRRTTHVPHSSTYPMFTCPGIIPPPFWWPGGPFGPQAYVPNTWFGDPTLMGVGFYHASRRQANVVYLDGHVAPITQAELRSQGEAFFYAR